MPRYCFLLHVRPDAIDEYRRRHRAVHEEMLIALRDTGWRNYSLHLAAGGLVVGHLEADDLDAARAAMARTGADARWQAEMAPLFERAVGDLEVLEEVFHLEDQLNRIGTAAAGEIGAGEIGAGDIRAGDIATGNEERYA